MVPLKEQINYDTWFNIPACVMSSTKSIQEHIQYQDKTMEFINNKCKSIMHHMEVGNMKTKIQFKEEFESNKKFVDSVLDTQSNLIEGHIGDIKKTLKKDND